MVSLYTNAAMVTAFMGGMAVEFSASRQKQWAAAGIGFATALICASFAIAGAP